MSKVRRPYALGNRLSWLFALLALVGLGLACGSVYVAMALILKGRASEELRARAELLRHVMARIDDPAVEGGFVHRLDDLLVGHGDMRITLTTPDGQRVYRNPGGPAWNGPSMRMGFTLSRAGGPGPDLRALIELDTESDRRLLRLMAWALSGATVLGASVVSLGGFWLVRVGLAPLRDLARQTQSLSAERLDTRIVAPGHARELQPWIEQLNALLDRLDRAYQQLEGFNADVAHELRTPLATLITRSEIDLAHDRSAAQLREAIASNLEELHRLASIVNDMLFLSRADRGARARLQAPGSVAHQVAEVVDFHEAAIEEAGLRVAVEGDAALAFDPPLLRRALSNLLGNATRHASPGSTIRFHIEAAPDGMVAMSLHNLGATIPAASLPRLFDRFYRVEPDRARNQHHHGLGLAIVAAIARMHGGRPWAESADGRTTIGIRLPASPPA